MVGGCVSPQHRVDLDVVLAYMDGAVPLALRIATPWLRRRVEQRRWIRSVQQLRQREEEEKQQLSPPPASLHRHRPREEIAIPRRHRFPLPPTLHHHDAMLLDQLWRQGRLNSDGNINSNRTPMNDIHNTNGEWMCGPSSDVLVMEDMSSTSHLFVSRCVDAPSESILYWLARPRCGEDKRWAARNRIPLAVDEMTKTVPDDAWKFVSPDGNCRTLPRARGLALHITERHLPWLSNALVMGLSHLQELYLSLDEGLLPPPREMWWWIRCMLIGRMNIRVLCIFPSPALCLGSSRKEFGEDDMFAPYVEEMGPISVGETALGCLGENSKNKKNGDCDNQCNNEFKSILHGNKMISDEIISSNNSTWEIPGLLSLEAKMQRSGGYETGTISQCEKSLIQPRLLDCTDIRGLESLPSLEVLYISPSAMKSLSLSNHSSTSLKELYLLSNTKLDSSGVRGLEDISGLEILWLEGTSIRDLSVLRCSNSLRELHIVLDYAFNTTTLQGIECISTLEVLHLERVSVDTLSFIGKSTTLRELILHACRIFSTKAFLDIEKAPLEYISLSYNDNLRDVNFLSRCKTLRQLLLTRCNGINTFSIAELGALPCLKMLALEFTRVDSTKVLSGNPSLQHLRLNGCKRVLRGSIIGLESCKMLQCLSLQDTNVISVEALYPSCSLVELDLSRCRHLEQQGVEGLVNIPTLEILRLSNTPINSVSFLQSSISLEELYIDNCLNIESSGLRGLELIPTLRTLFMTKIQANDISFLGKCQSLELLNIASMERLRTLGICGIESCSSLRHLNMAFCGVDSVTCLASGCCRLQYLNLRGCQRLTTEGLYGLEKLPVLTDIILDDLDLVTDMNHLAQCPALRRLSAVRCTSLTLFGVQELLARQRFIMLNL
ncbi:hypothetical protein LSM04_005349 [Trypanosoma melophagium]|uniref:uncharacterized protein n=1 Tax=Trypanosoma melophagium TaxID=715481 RepID=UPI00351AACC9|nr:hypothetical protein LSM04_005349 [Trypanosoma melophagium]